MQTFTAPITGNYKLEVWGASSGCHLTNSILQKDSYGRGGYSRGYYETNENQTIYVSIGGKGEDGKIARNLGGWNGGGDGEWDHTDDEAGGGGGGCTSVQISLKGDGQLFNYESVRNTDVLIVAGGGGGGYGNQYGGGETGAAMLYYNDDGKTNTELQATQDLGYAFGIGQPAPTSFTDNSEIPGGGGGWYGGYTFIPIFAHTWVLAGGGSGYIGGVSNGITIAGNQTFLKPGGGTETGHSGNGYCIISWISPSL